MDSLTPEMILVMSMIAVAVFLFITEWIRLDVVAILMMVTLPLLKLVTPAEAFIGLSSNAVVSIIAVIIIGAGLDKTGLINKLVKPILKIAGRSQSNIIIAISMAIAVISSFMQNIGAAALFLPAIQRISKSFNIPISRLLMPIGFSAILGGTITLVGSSPLILLNDLIIPFKLEPFSLFDVTPVGLSLVVSGIIYFIIFGRFVLPRGVKNIQEDVRSSAQTESPIDEMGTPYELRTPDNFTDYREPVRVADLRKNYLVNVVAITEPPDIKVKSPSGDTIIRSKVDLVVFGKKKDVERMARVEDMVLKESLQTFANDIDSQISGTVEAVVAPRSSYEGKNINAVNLQEKYSVTPMAIYRQGEIYRSHIDEFPLRVGDSILIHGTWKKLKMLHDEGDLLFTTPVDVELMRPEKAALAGIWLAVSLTMILVFKLQLSVCLMTGALGMVITRVLSIDEAYESVDWRTVFLLGGLIPLGMATEKTGTAAWIARTVLSATGEVEPIVLMTIIAILSTVFTLVISNVGATVLLVPLVVNMASGIGADPRMAALIVGIATSNSFLLPTHQVNALYMGPGRYRSVDFMKAGGIMSVLFIIVMIGSIYIFYGF
jgi:di/tricarboxylate transporter